MKPTPPTFATRLRTLREAAGLTQIQLAQAAGISKTAVTNYEQGRTSDPGLEMLTRLADGLKCPLDAFRLPPDPKRPRNGQKPK